MPSFIALGECMVEIAPADGGLCRQGFAGDTFNAAWYARQCLPADWAVDYGTCVGTDAISQAMEGFIAAQGIGTGAIRRVPDRTVGLYLISLTDGERSFSYWRSQSAARVLADDAAWLAGVLAGRGVIHVSGITLAILPPEGRARLAAALARARAAGVDAAAALAANDAHGFFGAVGGQVVTGPTLTNVNDFRAILVLPP